MGNKTNKCHFIPQVYLRKWLIQNKTSDINSLYCYDYINDQFEKSSQGKFELGLNDSLFQTRRLYTPDYEKELSEKFENYYNDWLQKIEQFYYYVNLKGTVNSSDFVDSESFKVYSFDFFLACENLLKFAFVQWIRYPDLDERIVLFELFKELLLFNETEYIELFSGEYIKFPDDRKIVATIVPGDKDVYKYAFGRIDPEKTKHLYDHLQEHKFVIFIDYSRKGKFVTSTYPVTPLFLAQENEPYGILFPISPYYSLRIEKHGRKSSSTNSNFPFQPCEGTDKFISDENQIMFLYNPKAKIIAGDKYIAKSVFSSFRNSSIILSHEDVASKIEDIKKQYKDSITLSDIYMENDDVE